MKFLVITQSDGKRRVTEHDYPSFADLQSKLVDSNVEDYRVFCEISDLVESLSLRVAALEGRLDAFNASIPATNDPKATAVPNKQQRNSQPNSNKVKVELVAKHLAPGNYDNGIYEDRIEFQIRFHNISRGNIRAVKGDLVFRDLFDAEIFRIGITMNDPIAPGQFATWSGGFPYNEFDREHAHFVGFKTEDLQLHLDNEKVVR